MPAFRKSNTDSREVMEGYTGRFYHSENTTVVHWDVAAEAPLPEHAHPHEQVLNVIEGEYELTVNGEKHTLSSGDVFVIPSNVPHSGISITACQLIDVFHPVREDYQ